MKLLCIKEQRAYALKVTVVICSLLSVHMSVEAMEAAVKENVAGLTESSQDDALLQQKTQEAARAAFEQATRAAAQEALTAMNAMRPLFDGMRDHFNAGILSGEDVDAFDEVKSFPMVVKSDALSLYFNEGFGKLVLDYVRAFTQETSFEPSEEVQVKALEWLFIRMWKLGTPGIVIINASQIKAGIETAAAAVDGAFDHRAKAQREKQLYDESQKVATDFVWEIRKALAQESLTRDFVQKHFARYKTFHERAHKKIDEGLQEVLNSLRTGESFMMVKELQAKNAAGRSLDVDEQAQIAAFYELISQAGRIIYYRDTSQSFEFDAIVRQLFEPARLQEQQVRLQEQEQENLKKLKQPGSQKAYKEALKCLDEIREALKAGTLQKRKITEDLFKWRDRNFRVGLARASAQFFDDGFDDVAIAYMERLNEKLKMKIPLTESEHNQGEALDALIAKSLHLVSMFLEHELDKLKKFSILQQVINQEYVRDYYHGVITVDLNEASGE